MIVTNLTFRGRIGIGNRSIWAEPQMSATEADRSKCERLK